MSFTIKGKILSIGEVKNFDNGAKAIDYQVETSEQYNNLYSFEMYKGAEHVEHIDNFIKYNKVGDQVSVEFNVRTNDYNGRFYTSLSPWRVDKLDQAQPVQDSIVTDDTDDLPF
tara:strand:+ start:96 stop:437 length:342 start_codon:yes stop_codon:yes gene_type:complete